MNKKQFSSLMLANNFDRINELAFPSPKVYPNKKKKSAKNEKNCISVPKERRFHIFSSRKLFLTQKLCQ